MRMAVLLLGFLSVILSCYNQEITGVSTDSGVCEQDRSYTLKVGDLTDSSAMTTSGAAFEFLSVPSVYTVTNSTCAGIPNVTGATAPTFNVRRDNTPNPDVMYLASFSDSSLNLTLTLTGDTINTQSFSISNSACKTEIQNLSGTLTYSATASSRQITFSYHAVITNLDNCSAF